MARAPFQALIIPFMIENDIPKYAIFKRTDSVIWQFISGGGEDRETPLEAAKRECFEKAIFHLILCYIKMFCRGKISIKLIGI